MAVMNAGLASEGFQLTASFDEEKILVCRPVFLTLELLNVSDGPLRTSCVSKWTDYRFDLRGADGANVPLTVFGRRLTEAETAGRQTTADLPPGGTFVDEILLNLMFDMSLPQKYVLHVERGVRKLNGSGFTVVVSNPAEVLIEIDN